MSDAAVEAARKVASKVLEEQRLSVKHNVEWLALLLVVTAKESITAHTEGAVKELADSALWLTLERERLTLANEDLTARLASAEGERDRIAADRDGWIERWKADAALVAERDILKAAVEQATKMLRAAVDEHSPEGAECAEPYSPCGICNAGWWRSPRRREGQMDEPVQLEFGLDLSDGIETVVMVELRPDGIMHILEEWRVWAAGGAK